MKLPTATDQLEHLCAEAFPAMADVPLGGWRMRAAAGFTGRANSTLTTGDPGMSVTDALRATEVFAEEHGIGPAAHVVVGSPHEQAIADRNWTVNLDHPGGAESLVMLGPLKNFAGDPAESRPTPGWWELAAQKEPTEAQRHVLGTGHVCFASIERDGETVSDGRSSGDGGEVALSRRLPS